MSLVCQVPVWSLPGHYMVPTLFLPGLPGPNMAPMWSTCSLYLVPMCSLRGHYIVCLFPTWSLTSPGVPIHTWYLSGPYMVAIWSLSGSFLIPSWSKLACLVPTWSLCCLSLVPVLSPFVLRVPYMVCICFCSVWSLPGRFLVSS